jgi:hypothetical protein
VVIEDAIVNRINELIAEAQSLCQAKEHSQVRSEAQEQQCLGWIAAAPNRVQTVIADLHSAYRQISEELEAQK